jgi:hypothetical protein
MSDVATPSKPQSPAPRDAISVAEIAARDSMSYSETADRLQRSGKIPARDPRAHLNPARVRQFADLNQDDLIREYGRLLEGGARTARDRDTRLRYLAALKLHRRNTAANAGARSFAGIAEKSAMRLAVAAPGDRRAQDALAMTAGMHDRAQRDYAMQGFSGPNATISKAARTQGRSWSEVRDDLVRFDVLPKKDPRREVKASHILRQKAGGINSRTSLPGETLELGAMKRLRKDPRDRQAMGWLAAAGAVEDGQKTRHDKTALRKPRGMNIEL